MNEKFENQKEQLLSLKHEISLLQQQVSYLLRNEKALELLDLDVLMNRTHTIYDQLCAINLDENTDDNDVEIDSEAFAGLFGGLMQEDEEVESVPTEVEETVETPLEEKPLNKPEEEVTVVEPVEEMPVENFVQQVDKEEYTDEREVNETEKGDEIGLFFRFENIPETEEESQPGPVEKDGKLVHFVAEIPEDQIPERDRVEGSELIQDNPLEMPLMEDEKLENATVEQGPLPKEDIPVIEETELTVEEEPQYVPTETFEVIEKPVQESLSDFFEKDDTEFELSTTETLGEKMMEEDRSLAAKLQQNSIRDLKSVIGINDKFLFVNELFGGSMEKYNKSIENLNDLKTLNGAMIYLNELKIELQWNGSNEAYQKLKSLVERKFE